MKNLIKKTIIFFIIMIMILPISLPIVSKAIDSGKILTSQEDYPIDVVLERDKENPNLVHITATSTESNIIELKYVHKYIETDNASYFEENHDDIYTFNITPAQMIEESFELDGYGSYTVFAKDENRNGFLARLTVNDPNDMPQITLTKEENSLNLNIDVTSNKNKITKLKIAKKENINDNIDFSTQGTDIEFIESTHVSVRYTEITEEGLYVVYAEDSVGNRTISQIYIAKQKTPISVDITKGINAREVNLHITDSICNIVSVKVAKLSEIGEDYDKFDTIDGLQITEGQTVDLSYTAPEDDTYIFCIEDEAGYKLITQKRITSQERVMSVTIAQDENSPGNLIITATNAICNIVEMKVAIGDDISLEYFENSGEPISIQSGREVVAKYTVQENCTINVYVKDEQGYTYMYKRNLIGIDDPEPEPSEAPTIVLTQNTENPKQIDVDVQADNSNVDEVKWAKGEQDIAYFATNGTRIGQDKVGVAIHTEFTISAIGTYTVYAKDDNGNEAIKTIEITNIEQTPPTEEDTTPPDIIINQENTDNENVQVSINVLDNLTNINMVKVAQGQQTIDYFENEGQELTIQKDDNSAKAVINVTENGFYTVYAKDDAGNATIEVFEVTTITEDPKIDDTTPPTIQTINESINENESIKVTINVTDTQSQISTIKIANGEQNVDYFENQGTTLKLTTDDKSAKATVGITENGTYTIYAEDEQGNKTVKVITITEIETPELDDTITSSVYVITQTMIDKISPNTDVNTFKNNISTEVEYTIVNSKGEELQNTQKIGTGDKLITETNKEYTLIVTGDLNGDGNVTLIDMSLLRKHYLEIESLQDEYLKAADMDNNNIISLRDIANMRKTILKID